MKKAGMRFQDILASLTTAPARRFGGQAQVKSLPGMDADIVVLADDPMTNIEALSNVRYTLRKGRVIYQSKGPVLQ